MKKTTLFLLAISIVCLTSLFITGCNPTSGQANINQKILPPSVDRGSLVSFFLNLKRPINSGLVLSLSKIEIQLNGEWEQLEGVVDTLDADSIGPGQLFITRQSIPPVSCKSIRLTFQQATHHGQPLQLTPSVIEMPFMETLQLQKGDSKTFFITWDLEKQLQDPTDISSAFFAEPQSITLTTDLAYVSCPDINTLYILRTDKNWVYGSIGIKGRPSHMTSDFANDRLYVLSEEDATIKVIEISTNTVLDTIPIPLGIEPIHMTVLIDDQKAYLLDGSRQQIAVMDLNTGMLTNNAQLNFRPYYATYISSLDQLAISSTGSHKVYILDPTTLATIDTIAVGRSPRGLFVNGGYLYIAESGDNTVSMYNLNSSQVENKIKVGRMPVRFAANANHIFISNYRSGALSVLPAGKSYLFKNIRVQGKPFEMATSDNRRWLYVGDDERGRIQVVDLTSKRLAGSIDLGTIPHEIEILQ